MEQIDLKKAEKIHFIGVGGIGMSAVARMMLSQGKRISGSDVSSSKISEDLGRLGVEVSIGQEEGSIEEDVDLVVYTMAIDKDNPELLEARRRKIPTMSYPDILGALTSKKFTIVMTGTHGKTTTTAMTAGVLIEAGLDPSVIVGSLMNDPDERGEQSNFIKGGSEYFVVEGCEYKESFLSLKPNILVITNLEEDHLDYYKDLSGIQEAFAKLAQKVGPEGFLICNTEDPKVKPVLEGLECKVLDYTDLEDGEINLQIPGEYNVENARAALAVAYALEIPKEKALRSIENFAGTWRRFEFKGESERGDLFFDDYAHHPTAIKALLKGVRGKYPSKEIVAIFQPHLYSRTKDFLKEFAESFSLANKVILTPVYPAREESRRGVDTEILFKEMGKIHKDVQMASGLENVEQMVSSEISKKKERPKIFISIGAGDVFKIYEKLSLN